MSQPTSRFLSFPIEIRNHVYSFASEDQPEIPLMAKDSKVIFYRAAGSGLKQRPRAFLSPQSPSHDERLMLVCSLTLSQTGPQLRSEFSDYLRTAAVDVVARVRNFDFTHVISFVESLPDRRKNDFLVAEDGNSRSKLYIELGGPYSDWQHNLMQWISFVESWRLAIELGASHKTIPETSSNDPSCRAPPGTIIYDVYNMYTSYQTGPGRLELDKIFHTLLGRYKAELAMRGGLPRWWSDTALLMQRRWFLVCNI